MGKKRLLKKQEAWLKGASIGLAVGIAFLIILFSTNLFLRAKLTLAVAYMSIIWYMASLCGESSLCIFAVFFLLIILGLVIIPIIFSIAGALIGILISKWKNK